MIRRLTNLTCRHGHRYYAPRLEWVEWVGKECLHGAQMLSDGRPGPGRCRLPLYPVTPEKLTTPR